MWNENKIENVAQLGMLMEGHASLLDAVDASFNATPEQKESVVADAVELSRLAVDTFKGILNGDGE